MMKNSMFFLVWLSFLLSIMSYSLSINPIMQIIGDSLVVKSEHDQNNTDSFNAATCIIQIIAAS